MSFLSLWAPLLLVVYSPNGVDHLSEQLDRTLLGPRAPGAYPLAPGGGGRGGRGAPLGRGLGYGKAEHAYYPSGGAEAAPYELGAGEC